MVAPDSKQMNNEELLQLAIKTAKNGQKDPARVMFRQVWTRDKRSETAMIWLAKLAKTPKERQEWLQRVLKVNPHNEAAKHELDKLRRSSTAMENRTLLLFGVLAFVMIVLGIAVVIIVLSAG